MDLNEKRKIDDELLDFVKELEYPENEEDASPLRDILLLGSSGLKSQENFSDYDLFTVIDKINIKNIIDILKRTEENENMYLIEIKFQRGNNKVKFRTLDELQKKYDEINDKKWDFVKLDFVIYIDYKLVELSIIYDTGDREMTDKCKKQLNKKIGININEMKDGVYKSKEQAIAVAYSQLYKKFPECNSFDLEQKLKDDIKDYKKDGKYYKALKREFSLLNYRYKQNKSMKLEKRLVELSKFFNSNFGKLYVIYSNLEAIKLMIDNYDDIGAKKRIKLNLKSLGIEEKDIEKVKDVLSEQFNSEAKLYF